MRFFEQAHIKDVLAYLRVVQNPRDEASWRRILLLLPGIGPAKAADVFQQIGQAADPLAALAAAEHDGRCSAQEQGILRGVRE